MKKLIYLAYKAVNAIAFSNDIRGKSLIAEKRSIFFDIKHSTTHLGDRLFLIDLIYSVSKSHYEIAFQTNDTLSISLFSSLGIKARKPQLDDVLCISLEPMYLYLLLKNRLRGVLFISNSKYSGPLAKEIARDFCSRLSIDYHEFVPEVQVREQIQYVLFSNYIDSGWFRKFFCNEAVLYKRCLEFRKQGFKIAHVGSGNDKNNDQRNYAFVDEDWRGETAIEDVVDLFKENRVAAVVSYDNFFLHLGNLFKVKTYVLFRGRFSKKATDFHHETVNIALLRQTELMEYLE